MKYPLFCCLALLLVPAVCAQAEPPLPAPQVRTHKAEGQGTFALRLPWAYDAAHPAPLVVVLPAPGKKPADALKADDWETIADRWGIILVAPASAERDVVASVIAAVRRVVKVEPRRVYIYGDERAAALRLVDVTATVVRSGRPFAGEYASGTFGLTSRQKASEAWDFFERYTRQSTTADNHAHRVTFVVTGLSDSQGQVAISLWNRKAGFGDGPKAVAEGIGTVQNGQAEVVITVRDAGEYGALILHDRNRNGKMDTSFGFPLEGFGASGNPRIRFSAPGWDECRFSVAPSDKERRIVVKAVYL